MDNNELYHHGILGQKWGIRRFQKNDGTLTPAGKKRRALSDMSDDEIKAKTERAKILNEYKATKLEKAKLNESMKNLSTTKEKDAEKAKKEEEAKAKKYSGKANKSPKKMSNEELTERIKRLELEKTYRDLDEKTKSRGHKFVMDVAETVGKNTLTNIGTQIGNSVLTYGTNTAIKALLGKNAKLSNEDRERLFGDLRLYTNNRKKDK